MSDGILLQKSLPDISGITRKRPFSMSEKTELDPTRIQRTPEVLGAAPQPQNCHAHPSAMAGAVRGTSSTPVCISSWILLQQLHDSLCPCRKYMGCEVSIFILTMEIIPKGWLFCFRPYATDIYLHSSFSLSKFDLKNG